MEGPPLGTGGEDITWPDQVAPRGRKASSTRKIKPQTSNLTKYNLLHHSQYGGIPNHRTTDHIFTMISNISLHPDIYHLYLDLNKAFNSVPHQALWQILHNYNFPE